MFNVYYSNQLSSLAEMLIHHHKINQNSNPFEEEVVLVQSVGMAQWLQMQIAEKLGVSGNFKFPFPTTFFWQQYRLFFELPEENIFERSSITWRLMRLIPKLLEKEDFESLRIYLGNESTQFQLKLYQLSTKIADLFDQYLVYRPHWLVNWENNNIDIVLNEIISKNKNLNKDYNAIFKEIKWQAILWNHLIDEVKKENTETAFLTSHRAYLQETFFKKLDNLSTEEKNKLPKRIFVFGISSLPLSQLDILAKLSKVTDIHLFFLNPSENYWGDNIEDKVLEKISLKQKLSEEDLEKLLEQQGNQLLSMWGKQGKDFLSQLIENDINSVELFLPYSEDNNLSRVKNAILKFNNDDKYIFSGQDKSIQIHSCHSALREVEVLHNQLLTLFKENQEISAKDIIIMTPDIDKYTPYIEAVFSRYETNDPRYIPFSISDRKIKNTSPIISSFLKLITFKEFDFNAEEILDLLDVKAIQEKFNFSSQDIYMLRDWIKNVGIRSGLLRNNNNWVNYNAWENGLERLLLGTSLKMENQTWENTLAFNESYGLNSEIIGKLVKFMDILTAWSNFIQQKHSYTEWKNHILQLLNSLYAETSESINVLNIIYSKLDFIENKIIQSKFNENLNIEVLNILLNQYLDEEKSVIHFLSGKVNFCTLLPMRAIPFKVVCLLGMNESDFPRQQTKNSFDLMQYTPQKGDRAKRDDDRYLFLEALLSAQNIFYISYIGQSITNDKELFPSILVSQLKDYLTSYSEENNSGSLITQHSASPMSLNNYSYDREWLELANIKEENRALFFDFENKEDNITEIDIEQLISYLQSPVRYIFNKKLGVYLSENEDIIEDTEHFSLSNLEAYLLKDSLLENKNPNIFFDNATFEGKLPVSYFGYLEKEKINQAIENLKCEVSSYISKVNEIIYLEKGIENITLFGNIANLYHNELVFWRVGNLRDKDIIKLWVYYLFISLNRKITAKFIYLDEGKVKSLTFNDISEEDAKKQLSIYIGSYKSLENNPKFAISIGLNDYFKNTLETDDTITYTTDHLLELSCGNNDESIYLERLLKQNSHLDFNDIHQNTLDWFKFMHNSKSK